MCIRDRFFERVQTQGYFLGKIIPYRGSWVEFEYDNKNLLYVRIDRKRKFYGTVFLRALGLKTDSDIIRAFYKLSSISLKGTKLLWAVNESLIGMKLSHAVTTKSGCLLYTSHVYSGGNALKLASVLHQHYRPLRFFSTVFLSRPAVPTKLAQALPGGSPGPSLVVVAA